MQRVSVSRAEQDKGIQSASETVALRFLSPPLQGQEQEDRRVQGTVRPDVKEHGRGARVPPTGQMRPVGRSV